MRICAARAQSCLELAKSLEFANSREFANSLELAKCLDEEEVAGRVVSLRHHEDPERQASRYARNGRWRCQQVRKR
ncbi:MAG: hypothetical protein AB7O44_31495 [Hyphomicrobiaceae bacterium]